jgi:hypothetical protein
MSFALPPIVKTAERLMLEIEQAVRGFARFHKYAIGAELRELATKAATLAHRAWRDQERVTKWVTKLRWQVDKLKLSMQIGQRLQAFAGLRQFEAIMRVAIDLGRQAGGWHRELMKHPKGQNPKRHGGSERAQILSTRVASPEAKS